MRRLALLVLLPGLAACGTAVEKQAEGVARKGEVRVTAAYECPDKPDAPCLKSLDAYDAADAERISMKWTRPDGTVVDFKTEGQDVSSVLKAVENQAIVTAQAAVEIARIQGQTLTQFVQSLVDFGGKIINPAGDILEGPAALEWARSKDVAAPVTPVTAQ